MARKGAINSTAPDVVELERRVWRFFARLKPSLWASLCLFGFFLAGCGGSSGPPPTAPPPVLVPTPLDGTWQTVLVGTEQRVTLTLGPGYYGITRGLNAATGVIAIMGNRIEFSQSSACVGTSAYTWTLTGNSLRFTMVNDPCPGRSEVLDGYTYIKSG